MKVLEDRLKFRDDERGSAIPDYVVVTALTVIAVAAVMMAIQPIVRSRYNSSADLVATPIACDPGVLSGDDCL